MRCTQIAGLPDVAEKFLNENVLRYQKCPMCGCGGGMKRKQHKDASSQGMFDDGPMLDEYDCKDGVVAREEVQCAPWASGPVIFLKLECFRDGVAIGKYEWTEAEIQKNL